MEGARADSNEAVSKWSAWGRHERQVGWYELDMRLQLVNL